MAGARFISIQNLIRIEKVSSLQKNANFPIGYMSQIHATIYLFKVFLKKGNKYVCEICRRSEPGQIDEAP